MDNISKEKRSWNMSRIRSKDTVPEKKVRSCLYKLGYRFRLHRNDLPGKPDIILPKYKKTIFVNGCYWHRHEGCKFAYTPKTRTEFWQKKFADNVTRDIENKKQLEKLGWEVNVIWECETKDIDILRKKTAALFRETAQI